jgi:hypothetical protein
MTVSKNPENEEKNTQRKRPEQAVRRSGLRQGSASVSFGAGKPEATRMKFEQM